ncbi:MAG: tetratricopeptide repeat protein [bacterium]
MSIGIGAGWVAYLIQNQFSFGMNLTSSLFWIMMGMMMGAGNPQSSQREKVMKSKNRIIIWSIGVPIFIIILILFRYTISAYKANIYYKEGVRFLDQKNYAQASLKCERALKLNPYEEWYYKGLINIYLKRATGGEKEYAKKGMALAEKANRLFPNDLILYNLLGAAYQLNGRYDQAISAYKKAINRSPYFEDAYDNLAKIYFNQHRYDEAIKTLKTGLKFSPYSKKYLSLLGHTYRKMGNLKEAIRTYSKTLDPSYPKSYKSLGYAFYKAGEIDKAISCFKIAARLLPEDISLHRDLGSFYYVAKNLKEAKAQFEYVLKNLNPNDEYAKRMLHTIETKVQ